MSDQDAGIARPDSHQAPQLNRAKLYRPHPGADTLARPRLLQRLDQAADLPVTLLVAPAGYGKSTLVARWLGSRADEPCVWLSLDPLDTDLRRFLGYLLGALELQAGSPLQATRELQAGASLPPPAALAACLAEDLHDAFDRPVHVVLEDLHMLAGESPVHALIQGLLERPCGALHLTLVTRADPPLPLATLRARNRIAELRTSDLQFTPLETATFLSTLLEIEISEAGVARLHARLEGWPAGVRLAAHALRQMPDPARQLATLHETLPDVSDYLTTEVLGGLPDPLRDHLIRAAVLDRFCAGLLDDVVSPAGTAPAGDDGEAICQALRGGGLFAVVLDPQARWLRFQHTFREVLQHQLRARCSAAEIAGMHGRAATWFERYGFVEEAIIHAKLANDEAEAAAIVERHWRPLVQQDNTWWLIANWLRLLSADAADHSISLQIAHAWMAHYTMNPGEIRARLTAIDALLEDSTPSEADLSDLQFFRAMDALWSGDLAGCRRFAAAAIPPVGGRNSISAGTTRMFLALAQHMDGAPAEAARSVRLELGTALHEPLYLTGLLSALAFLNMIGSELSTARQLADDITEFAVQNARTHMETWGAYIHAFCDLQLTDFDRAIEGFARLHPRVRNFTRRAATDALCGRALAYQLDRRPDMAAEATDELREHAIAFGDELSLEFARSCRARLALLQGDCDAALAWARSFDGPAAPSPYSLLFWIEVPRITQLRALIVAGTRQEREAALTAIARLRVHVQKLHLQGQDIELAVLTALALTLLERDEASAAIADAVALAAPGEWLRPFVEAGEPLAAGIGALATIGPNRPFLDKALKATQAHLAPSSARRRASPSIHMIDLLTQREQEILGLLERNLLNKQIAVELHISDQTVKDHLKHIYRKLEVANRREAFAKARRLGMLKGSPPL